MKTPISEAPTLLLLSCVIVLVILGLPSAANGQSSKSLSTARWASSLSTAAPLVLVGTAFLTSDQDVPYGAIVVGWLGLIYGPSVGHAYAGNTRRFFTSSSLRLLYTATSATGVVIMGVAAYAGMDSGNDGLALGLFIGGAIVSVTSLGLLVYSVIRDFTHLDDSVNAYNQKHGSRSLRLEPIYFPREKTVGLALTLRF